MLEMEKISVSRALAGVKLLDARISKEINNGKFVTSVTGKKTVTNANLTKEDFDKYAKASKQSIEDLIKRRKAIKQKISLVNATTKVKIGVEEYFVAEAIERKQSINNDITYLNKLKQNLVNVENEINTKNNQMENKLDSLLSDKMGSEKSKTDEVIEFQKSYRDLNETKIYDVIGIKEVIEKLENEIYEFQSNVDFALSEINATTFIEI